VVAKFVSPATLGSGRTGPPTRAELMPRNERRPGTCCYCGRDGVLHIFYSDDWPVTMTGTVGLCCSCRGCKRGVVRVRLPGRDVAQAVALHEEQVRVRVPRRRFARRASALLRLRCQPGTHRGRRLADGSVVCRVCGTKAA